MGAIELRGMHLLMSSDQTCTAFVGTTRACGSNSHPAFVISRKQFPPSGTVCWAILSACLFVRVAVRFLASAAIIRLTLRGH